MIIVKAFGGLEVGDEARGPITALLAQPKRSALLAYLVIAHIGGFCRRDTLLALFWPDQDEEGARRALSQALTFLRRHLGSDVLVSRGPDELGANPTRVRSDVAAFEQALAEGDWEAALAHYQGGLLEGLHVAGAAPFVDWVDRERERLREAASGAAWKRAHALIEAGRLVDAERTAQQALLLVPTDESPVRAFIEALAAAGDRAAAIRFYEKFKGILARELEVEPAGETRAVVEAVRGGRIGPKSATDTTFAEPPRGAPEVRPATSSPPVLVNPAGGPPSAEAVPAAPARTAGWRKPALIGALLLLIGTGVMVTYPVARPRGEPRHAADADSAAAVDPASLVVIPFRGASGGSTAELLCSGITGELITQLVRAGLKVIGQSASVTLIGDEEDVRLVAATYRVGHALEGDCAFVGDEMRINVRLVDGATAFVSWTGTYQSEDLLTVRDDVARGVAAELPLALGAAPPPPQSPPDPQAYREYVLARAFAARLTAGMFDSAVVHYHRALARDSTYADAYAGLSFVLMYPQFGSLDTLKNAEIRQAATSALRLDPSLAEPHVALANIATDRAEKRRELDSALSLDPDFLWALFFSSLDRYVHGEQQAAAAEMGRLLRSDPFLPESYYGNATLHNALGRWELADSLAKVGLAYEAVRNESAPSWAGYWNRAMPLLMLGRFEEAESMIRAKARAVSDQDTLGLGLVMRGITAVHRGAPDSLAARTAAVALLDARVRGWSRQPEVRNRSRPPCGWYTFDCFWVPVYYLLLGDTAGMWRVIEHWPPDEVYNCYAPLSAFGRDPRLLRVKEKAGLRCDP